LILVGWEGQNDPLNPVNQTTVRKLFMTVIVSLIALSVTAASAIDACGVREYSEYFRVSNVVGSLATGMLALFACFYSPFRSFRLTKTQADLSNCFKGLFLIGFAFGSLLSGPFSETFGRNAIYLSTMLTFLVFIMASGLAPNLQGHLIFRFLAGFFASTPLSCAGGTVADLWNPVQKTYAFPIYAIPAFSGPMIGQMIGSYIPVRLGWRWLEWTMLIMGGIVLVLVLLFQSETYGDLILYWKASILRKETGDERYRAPLEMKGESLGQRLKLSVSRPFAMFYSELIIILISLYLTIIYIVLFTFLEGYTYVFGQTYGISEGLTSLCWTGMLVGTLLVGCVVPVVYNWTAKASIRDETPAVDPEMRLWYAMLGGAPAVPVSLFWMGWTSNVSPLGAESIYGRLTTFSYYVAARDLDMVSSDRLRLLWLRHYNHLHRFLYVSYRFLRYILGFCTRVSCVHAVFGRGRGDHCWRSDLSVYRSTVYTDDTRVYQCDNDLCALYALYLRTKSPQT
jgi:MFS family permease